MQADISGIMAAPNCSKVKARIFQVKQSEQYADKWLLEFEILESQGISGPNFAHVGQIVEGFTIRDKWEQVPPVVVEAEAEYIGGPQNGVFQLTNLQPTE